MNEQTGKRPRANETILLVDDEQAIVEPLRYHLEREGYAVIVAHDGEAALSRARADDPDLIVLDLMLPKLDGWEVCRILRQESTTPIIMLTARDEESSKVLGLNLGADDYLTKPFSFQELLARVRALLRRVAYERTTPGEAVIRIGAVALDTQAHRVSLEGETLQMTQMEYKLLQTLMERSGHVVRRNDLMDRVWGIDWIGDTHTLDVHIRWLRQKIEPEPGRPRYIQTVRGVGYRFATPEEVET
ncbi:MAG: response regulator transcription factor [Anaerolineae bacterium]|nr:response regulator transcription factor [Anaerolineae bacterium]